MIVCYLVVSAVRSINVHHSDVNDGVGPPLYWGRCVAHKDIHYDPKLPKPPIARAPLWLRESDMVLWVTEIRESRTTPETRTGGAGGCSMGNDQSANENDAWRNSNPAVVGR